VAAQRIASALEAAIDEHAGRQIVGVEQEFDLGREAARTAIELVLMLGDVSAEAPNRKRLTDVAHRLSLEVSS
jgi:hypothetical protein